jgi:hypothetical protein
MAQNEYESDEGDRKPPAVSPPKAASDEGLSNEDDHKPPAISPPKAASKPKATSKPKAKQQVTFQACHKGKTTTGGPEELATVARKGQAATSFPLQNDCSWCISQLSTKLASKVFSELRGETSALGSWQ